MTRRGITLLAKALEACGFASRAEQDRTQVVKQHYANRERRHRGRNDAADLGRLIVAAQALERAGYSVVIERIDECLPFDRFRYVVNLTSPMIASDDSLHAVAVVSIDGSPPEAQLTIEQLTQRLLKICNTRKLLIPTND